MTAYMPTEQAALIAVEPDINDPRTWFKALVDAVIAYRIGATSLVQDYLRFVSRHRGRECAIEAGETVKRYAAAKGWEDVHQWPAWGYQAKPPAKAYDKPKTPSKRKRR